MQFPRNHGSLRQHAFTTWIRSCFFGVIREIAVPQAAARGCVDAEPACHSAVLPFIRPIVVPTGSGAMIQTWNRNPSIVVL
jgi:hypothetical protein